MLSLFNDIFFHLQYYNTEIWKLIKLEDLEIKFYFNNLVVSTFI